MSNFFVKLNTIVKKNSLRSVFVCVGSSMQANYDLIQISVKERAKLTPVQPSDIDMDVDVKC
jgi:hypothetical protein